MAAIALVSCVSKKDSHPCAAQDLYQSTWFLKARAYVEQQYPVWYILSAQHGLLQPGEVVAPYDKTLNKTSAHERRQWSAIVLEQVQQTLNIQNEIHIFAGMRYREYLVPLLGKAGYTVVLPLEGLKIGQQLSWLKSGLPLSN